MSSFLEITPDKLNRIIGTSGAQTLVDVRCRHASSVKAIVRR